MSEPQRKLRLAGRDARAGGSAISGGSLCPLTGIGIPECSCGRCIEEQIRHNSPALLDRRFRRSGGGPRRAA